MKKLMNFKSGLVAVVLALAVITGMSAFTKTSNERKSYKAGYFYKYKLSTYTESQIKAVTNYQRVDAPCSGTQNVCGVYLDTDNGNLSQPDVTEFNIVKSDLWSSQQAHAPASPEIAMRN